MTVVKLILLSLWMTISFAAMGEGFDDENTSTLFAGLGSAIMCGIAIKLYLF